MGAVAEIAVRCTINEWRVSEQCGSQRLQRERDAKLAHHVRFALKIEVGLHRAGAQHHVESQRAFGRHIGAHDIVACLRHHRHVLTPPFGLDADAEKAEPQLVADLAHLVKMAVHLLAGLMHGGQRRTREFELAARLERDRLVLAGQRNRPAGLQHRRPAKALQAFEQGTNATLAVIGHRREVVGAIADFFVLGADAPVRAWFAAFFQIGHQFACAGYGSGKGLLNGHRNSGGAGVGLSIKANSYSVARNRRASPPPRPATG